MLNARMVGGKQRDAVVHLIEGHQGCIPDAIIRANIEQPRPERFVAARIGGLQADMAEFGNARIAGGKVALP